MQKHSPFTFKSPKVSPIRWNYRTSSLYRTSTPVTSAESLRNDLSTIKSVSDETLVEMYPYDKDVAEAYGWDKSKSTISTISSRTHSYMMACSTDASLSEVDSKFMRPSIPKTPEQSVYSVNSESNFKPNGTFWYNPVECPTRTPLPSTDEKGRVKAKESMKKLCDVIERRKERSERCRKEVENNPCDPSERDRDYSMLGKSDVGYGELADYNCGHWDLRQFSER